MGQFVPRLLAPVRTIRDVGSYGFRVQINEKRHRVNGSAPPEWCIRPNRQAKHFSLTMRLLTTIQASSRAKSRSSCVEPVR